MAARSRKGEEMGAINDGGCTRRLAPGSSTCRRWWAQYDCGCTRRLRPSGAKAANRISPPRRALKSEICSAEVIRFASNPPPRRIANYPESKFYLNSSLLTNYFESPSGLCPLEAARKPLACTQRIGAQKIGYSAPESRPRTPDQKKDWGCEK